MLDVGMLDAGWMDVGRTEVEKEILKRALWLAAVIMMWWIFDLLDEENIGMTSSKGTVMMDANPSLDRWMVRASGRGGRRRGWVISHWEWWKLSKLSWAGGRVRSPEGPSSVSKTKFRCSTNEKELFAWIEARLNMGTLSRSAAIHMYGPVFMFCNDRTSPFGYVRVVFAELFIPFSLPCGQQICLVFLNISPWYFDILFKHPKRQWDDRRVYNK